MLVISLNINQASAVKILIYSCENQVPIVLVPVNKFKFAKHDDNAPRFFEIIPVS